MIVEVDADMIYEAERLRWNFHERVVTKTWTPECDTYQNFCPLALGIKKALKSDDVLVGVTHVDIKNRLYRNMQEVFEFVERFDTWQGVEPTRFWIDMNNRKVSLLEDDTFEQI